MFIVFLESVAVHGQPSAGQAAVWPTVVCMCILAAAMALLDSATYNSYSSAAGTSIRYLGISMSS